MRLKRILPGQPHSAIAAPIARIAMAPRLPLMPTELAPLRFVLPVLPVFPKSPLVVVDGTTPVDVLGVLMTVAGIVVVPPPPKLNEVLEPPVDGVVVVAEGGGAASLEPDVDGELVAELVSVLLFPPPLGATPLHWELLEASNEHVWSGGQQKSYGAEHGTVVASIQPPKISLHVVPTGQHPGLMPTKTQLYPSGQHASPQHGPSQHPPVGQALSPAAHVSG